MRRLPQFAALTYPGQRRRLRCLALQVLPMYGLGAASLRLRKFEDAAIYQVATRQGERYALRISIAAGNLQPELLSELLWIEALRRDIDLLVPEPIPARSGALVTSAQLDRDHDVYCYLLRWLPGPGVIRAPHPSVLARAGEIMARLHQHARFWIPPPDFVRPSYYLESFLGPNSTLGTPENLALLDERTRAVISATSERVRSAIGHLGRSKDVFGLLHADLNMGNFVVMGEQLGVIDFDDCGWGYYLYDLAVMFRAVRRAIHDRHLQARLRDAYLAGYTRVATLSDQQLQLLPAFLALRELVLTTFILESKNLKMQEWGPERIQLAAHQLESYLRDEALIV